jgi:hypothetical protein
MENQNIKTILETISATGYEVKSSVYDSSQLSNREKLIKLTECSIKNLLELAKISKNKTKITQLCIKELDNIILSYQDLVQMKKPITGSCVKLPDIEILTTQQILDMSKFLTDSDEKIVQGALVAFDSVVVSTDTALPYSVVEIVKAIVLSEKANSFTRGLALRCLCRNTNSVLKYHEELLPVAVKFMKDPELTFFGVYYLTALSMGNSKLIPLDLLVDISKMIVANESSLTSYNALIGVYNSCFVHKTHPQDKFVQTIVDTLMVLKDKELIYYCLKCLVYYNTDSGIDKDIAEQLIEIIRRDDFQYDENTLWLLSRLVFVSQDGKIIKKAEEYFLQDHADLNACLSYYNQTTLTGCQVSKETVGKIIQIAANKATNQFTKSAVAVLYNLTEGFIMIDEEAVKGLECLLYDPDEEVRNLVLKVISQNTDNIAVMRG